MSRFGIVRTQGGRPVLDIRITKTDMNDPYEVFPVPDGVQQANQVHAREETRRNKSCA